MEMYVYLWLAILAIALIVEGITFSLVCIWFMPSAIICAVLAYFNVPSTWQYVVFFALSFLLMVLFRKPLVKFVSSKKKDTLTNLDSIIGCEARVEEEINNFINMGRVNVKSQSWSARSINDTVIPKDSKVIVKKIEGVKLICEYIEKQ